jgi:hypothetical protein
VILKKNGSGGNITESRGLFRIYPYLGTCFLIISVWWLAANIYLFLFKGPISGAWLFQQGIEAAVLYTGFAAALILLAVNIVRILIILFGKPIGGKLVKTAGIPIVFYIYLSIFVLLAIAIMVLVIIGKAGTHQGGIVLWDNTFYIFRNGN